VYGPKRTASKRRDRVSQVQVHVRFFASAADRAGQREADVVVEAPGEAMPTTTHLREVLTEAYPALADLLPVCALAVNGDYAGEEVSLPPGAEVAVIPPVSGGDAPKEAIAQVVEEPLSLQEAVAAVSHPGAGAVVVFVGTVRDHADGHPTQALRYEAYVPLAVRQMERILGEVAAQGEGVRLVARHRVGTLSVGEVAVVVAASAPHRASAFAACSTAMDRIKAEVPIWKEEIGPQGRRWKEGTPVPWAPRSPAIPGGGT
jgi:molybdopterin synthase catalytic subunit/molybdopterin converting factor small subunit